MPNAVATWAEIEALPEYAQDFDLIQSKILSSFGNDQILDDTDTQVRIISKFIAVIRYYARHLPDQKDIDRTSFFIQLAKEVGFDLPFLNEVPALELLRENKRWFGHKGSEVLYDFAGDLVGSPIEIDYPYQLIFDLDNDETMLDGAPSNVGELPFKQSHLGRFEDGVYWSWFVYVVNILQGQNVHDFNDLESIILNIHPLGMKRFMQWTEVYDTDVAVPSTIGPYQEILEDIAINADNFPTLDNDFYLDNTDSLLDSQYGDDTLLAVNINEIPLYQSAGGPSCLAKSTLFDKNRPDPSRPWVCFSRDIQTPTTASIVNEAHTYATAEATYTLVNHTLGISSPPTVVNVTQSLTYIGGSDYIVDCATGLITWITLPTNLDVLHFSYTYFSQMWTTVYSDNDASVYENVTTNVGIGGYTIDLLSTLTWRQLKNAAWGKDQQNMQGMWLQAVPYTERIVDLILAGHDSVAASATSATFSLGYPASGTYVVTASASWATTVYVTIIDLESFTLTFGTAAPGDGSGIIDYEVELL